MSPRVRRASGASSSTPLGSPLAWAINPSSRPTHAPYSIRPSGRCANGSIKRCACAVSPATTAAYALVMSAGRRVSSTTAESSGASGRPLALDSRILSRLAWCVRFIKSIASACAGWPRAECTGPRIPDRGPRSGSNCVMSRSRSVHRDPPSAAIRCAFCPQGVVVPMRFAACHASSLRPRRSRDRISDSRGSTRGPNG